MNDDPATTVVLRRLLRVPRERVFAAWLDPVSLAQWMCPGDVESASAQVDARVGGKFRIVMMHSNVSHEHSGEYLAIEAPSLLSFSWISLYTDLQPTVVTVELFERGGGTELVLTHRRLPPSQVDSHRNGWGEIIRKLEATLVTKS